MPNMFPLKTLGCNPVSDCNSFQSNWKLTERWSTFRTNNLEDGFMNTIKAPEDV